ncbi:hypothetical protein GF325_03755 [Candidatus Bathyarchaeota archaeon]|nr:hypothetical protein [Candidatus Bathyarchaeota archaeon]
MQTYNIAILGTSSEGLSVAAYLGNEGHAVSIWGEHKDSIEVLKQELQVRATGLFEKDIPLKRVSTNLSKVVKDANVIITCTNALDHEKLAKEMAPHLSNFQVVLLVPGQVFGAISFLHAIHEEDPDLKIFAGEAQYHLISAKKKSETWVEIESVHEGISCCFFPEINKRYVDYIMSNVFPGIRVEEDIRLTSLVSPESILIPAIGLFNISGCCKEKEISFFKECKSDEVIRMIDKLDGERMSIMETIGMQPIALYDWHKSMKKIEYSDYHLLLLFLAEEHELHLDVKTYKEKMMESMIAGLIPIASVAAHLELDTPVMDAFIMLWRILFKETKDAPHRTIESAKIPVDLFKKRATKRVSASKVSIDSYIDKICTQILDDFEEGWIFIQAPRKVIEIVKEHIHDSTGVPITPENWKQYFSYEKKSRIIAMVKRSSELKDAFELGSEFNELYGIVFNLDEQDNLTAAPILFEEHKKKEAKDFIKSLKDELREFLSDFITQELKDSKKEILVKDVKVKPEQE